MSAPPALTVSLRACWRRLGIAETLLAERGLPMYEEAFDLQTAETGHDGRIHELTPTAAQAWSKMKAAAAADAVPIFIVSAHRSISRQIEIFERKLAAGQSIAQILCVSAPPGCSEHHTGRAIDIGTVDSPPLEEVFETTPAFGWLEHHAAEFGFSLSYPRGNARGYDYEPWHWCFESTQSG